MANAEGPERKDRFTALDTLALARETRAFVRRRLDRAFDAEPGGVALRFRLSEEGPRELRLFPGRYGAVLPPSGDHPDTPGVLARELRRLLSGALLSGVTDPKGERLLQLEFTRSDASEPLRLVAELFGTGNVVVVQGARLVAVAKPRRYSNREIRVGADYRPPPARPDPFDLPASALGPLLRTSTKDRVSTVAARIGFGGPIAEELLARLKLDPRAPAATEAELVAEQLAREADRLRREVADPPRGFLTRLAGELVDVAPYRSLRWMTRGSAEEVETVRFSEAAEAYFRPMALAAREVARPTTDPRAELERQRLQQLDAIAALESEATARQRQAEAIFSHYTQAEEALREADPAAGPVVEAVLGDVEVPLRRASTPRESAQWLYDESKRVQAKLAGARMALEKTDRAFAAAVPPPRPHTASASSARAARRAWFEQFRWFLSSSGEIVVAGRDAASNDLVVRRYLKERDWYVHADLHGASSVVVKHREDAGEGAPEASFREAGQFAVSFSKAWRAGHVVGRAFWVEAEKVSKAGGSGEYVGRGAWAIHGTKHFLDDLPLELGLGTVVVEGRERWTAAPSSAVQAHGAIRYLLTPGDERDRGRVEVELARELGVSRDLLQSLLPAGGVAVRRA